MTIGTGDGLAICILGLLRNRWLSISTGCTQVIQLLPSIRQDRDLIGLSDLLLETLQVFHNSAPQPLVEVVVEHLYEPAKVPELLDLLASVDRIQDWPHTFSQDSIRECFVWSFLNFE